MAKADVESQLFEQPISRGAAAALLFLSGACALVYQIVWMRELRLVFGATTAASAAVLAIFMGGLGLGNAVLGARMDRSLRPFRLYGLMEAGIACSAALSPFLIDCGQWAYIAAGGQHALGSGAATLARLLTSTAILALPTFLMGGTMPAAARAVSVDGDIHRRSVALIYGLNTLGAVLGAGLANFLLLEALGSRAVLWLAAGVNLLLAGIALAISRRAFSGNATRSRSKRRHAVNSSKQEVNPVIVSSAERGALGIVCAASCVVGFAFFLMEIVWYRTLGTLLGGTTFTFGLILCTALLGIGLGGGLYHFMVSRFSPSLALFSLTCSTEALLVAVPFWYGDRIALWVLSQQLHSITSFQQQLGNWFQVAAFVILPSAVVAGFQFPLLIAIAGRGRHRVAQHVGWTFAANTCGAIAGSLAGGFFLMPLWTAPGAWRGVILLLVGLAIIVLITSRSRQHWHWIVVATTASLAILGASSQGPTAVWRHAGIGAGRAKLDGAGRNAEQDFLNKQRRQVFVEAEGIESSVAITVSESLSFVVNGKSDGNAISDAGTQIGLGLLGALLHQAPRAGLVIGLGTGETAGWLADVESMESVDVVELEIAVTAMTKLCSEVNRHVLDNPSVHLHVNDAREFLLTSTQEYDVIVSEPSNPYRAGIANLYTREFYQAASRRLAAQGLFLQWLQGYEVDDRTVRIVLHTLRSVFPTVEVWRTKANDMVLLCRMTEQSNHDAEALAQRCNQATMRTGLRQVWRVSDVEGVLAHYICGPSTLDAFLGDTASHLNTDDCNLLEYAFAKTVGKETRFSAEQLQAMAAQRDDVWDKSVNREKVAQRRLAMLHWLGNSLPRNDKLSASLEAKAEAFRLYADRRYAEAVAQLRSAGVDSACPIESSVFAHALAESGEPIPGQILDATAASSQAEAFAVQAIWQWRNGKSQAAAQLLLQTFAALKKDPWAHPHVLEAMLRVTDEAAAADTEFASQFYYQLATPFMLYRMNDRRLLLRLVLAQRLGDEQVVESLAPLEPDVLWQHWILESRARAYTSRQHPRARAAQADLHRFRRWAGQ